MALVNIGYSSISTADSLMETLWSAEYNVVLERLLWLEVLKFHVSHGLAPLSAVDDYEKCRFQVNLESITKRELVTRHDVKARIEEYNALAGHEYIHLGMTSADVVDNTTLSRMNRSSALIIDCYPPAKGILTELPFRGIKGAVGTQQDQLTLLKNPDLCGDLDRAVAIGMKWSNHRNILGSVGQVYPRTLDLQWASQLFSLVAGIRDPRIAIAAGFLQMIASYAGHQWNEGDVSNSVTRRVAIPAMANTVYEILFAYKGSAVSE